MFASESENFYASQLRPHGIASALVAWMASVPIEQCLHPKDQPFAYADQGLPLGGGRTGLRPFEVAFMLRALGPSADESVLEIGHSCGYFTALLAKQCCSVLCIEPSVKGAARIQKKVLEPLGVKNAQVREGDASVGWGEEPYAIILINGAIPFVPEVLKEQLTFGGRLFAVVGEGPIMQAMLITRQSQSRFSEQVLFDAYVSPYVSLSGSGKFLF